MSTSKPITLIATLGSTPAVLTEMLYKLLKNGDTVNRIIVLTTKHGKERFEKEALAYPEGAFYQLCGELRISPHTITIEELIVPTDENGEELDDIRSKEQDEVFANKLQQVVIEHCNNTETRVYGLLSGGRKTMSAHLFSAMQLYARTDDRLYHVLVSEPFDTIPEFYFPAKDKTMLKDRKGNEHDASTAKIELIDIPFIPLRGLLEGTEIDFNRPYSNVLTSVSEQLRMSASLPVRKLFIHVDERKIFVNKLNTKHAIQLPYREFSVYLYLAIQNKLSGSMRPVKIDKLFRDTNLLHLCYYMLKLTERNYDGWHKSISKDNFKKVKSNLKKEVLKGLNSSTTFKDISIHNVLEYTDTIPLEDAKMRLPISPENIELLWNRPKDIKTYLEDYFKGEENVPDADQISGFFKEKRLNP